ncbi:MAG: glycosyltransferase, partial [Bacteroidia bacterium]|nr:glycosyltransferase [Bacteroidia bacterium]
MGNKIGSTVIAGVIVLTVALAYALTLLRLRKTWDQIEPIPKVGEPVAVSLIVVFRNEEADLPALLTSIENQDYPVDLLEVILVDDGSTDASFDLVSEYAKSSRFEVIGEQLTNHGRTGKKAGIQLAVERAKNDRIVVTDADCTMPKNWLATITRSSADFASGPVCYHSRKSIWAHMVELDLISLSVLGGCTIQMNRPNLANGANMSFSRSTFFKVGGYSSNETIPSGDDVFLLMRIASQPNTTIQFVKSDEAIVSTQMVDSFKAFVNQRIRWAGKTRFSAGAESQRITWVLFMTYGVFFSTPFLAVFFANVDTLTLILLAWVIKIAADASFF